MTNNNEKSGIRNEELKCRKAGADRSQLSIPNSQFPIRRYLALALVLVLLALGLSGCHGSRGRAGFEVPEAFDTSRNYEVTFWAKNDTNKTQTEIYKKAIEGFEALYPNVTVTMKLYTDYSRIYNDVITNISTDTTPNVCITYPDHIATYMTGDNVVVPLDGLIDDARYAQRMAELHAGQATGVYAFKRKLMAKGISEDDAQEALAAFDDDQQRAACRVAAEKLWRKYEALPRREARAKLSQALARRGFGWDAIESVLDDLVESF